LATNVGHGELTEHVFLALSPNRFVPPVSTPLLPSTDLFHPYCDTGVWRKRAMFTWGISRQDL